MQLEQITNETVKGGIKELKRSTAGMDQWSPAVWRNISDEAINELTKLLNHVQSRLTWPAHIYHNLIVLMGKPMGWNLPTCPDAYDI